jgi:hypothetical protein
MSSSLRIIAPESHVVQEMYLPKRGIQIPPNMHVNSTSAMVFRNVDQPRKMSGRD